MSRKKLIQDFTEGNVTKQLLLFASPLFLSSLLQTVYNMADMVIVGQKLGKAGLSSVAVGGDVTNFLTFFAMGFSNAGQVIISQYIGAKEEDKVGRFICNMASFLMGLAAVMSILCLTFRRQILQLMQTPEEAFSGALSYSTICMAGLVFIYGYNMVSAILRGMGDSARPFIFISISASVNVVLDLLFVMKLELGAGGAALATVISQALSFFLCMAFIIRNRERYSITVRREEMLRLDKGMMGSMIALGFPMAIKGASVQFSKLFVNSWINSYGVTVSAFAGVANKINLTTNLVSNSFNTAGATMVGQNIAAEKFQRVRKVMLSVFGVTFTTATLFTLSFFFFAEQIYGFFTSDPEVIRLGIAYFPIAVLIFYGSCGRSGMNALINGSGNYKVNFVCAILDGIVMRIGLSVLFGLWLSMGYMGFWLGDALAGFTPLVLGIFFYMSGAWKKPMKRA